MRKVLTLIPIIILGILTAGAYGMLHDQISYTVSEEYFTKFKFEQFEIQNTPNRIGASIVGFLATWWVGFPISIVLGLIGLRFKNSTTMFVETMKTIGLTLLVALITALFGLIIGAYFYNLEDTRNFEGWIFPEGVIDTRHFKIVGIMHSFSYLGGFIGLIVGIFRQIRRQNVLQATNTEGGNSEGINTNNPRCNRWEKRAGVPQPRQGLNL